MIEQPRKSRVGLYIALAIIAVFVIGGIALTVMISNFLKSPEGKRLAQGITATAKMEEIMPNLIESLESYKAKKGGFPDSMDELKDYGANPGTIAAAKDMTYTKPAADAPDDTVILERKMDFMQGSEMRVQVTKGLQARQVTIAPMGRKGRVRLGTESMKGSELCRVEPCPTL
jgi:hypothetical protein